MNVTTSGKYVFNNKSFSQMPSVASLARDVRNHLGVGMAEKEWQDNPILLAKNFFILVHIIGFWKKIR